MLKQVLLNLTDGFSLKKYIYICGSMLKKGLSFDTTFNLPFFSSDFIFEAILSCNCSKFRKSPGFGLIFDTLLNQYSPMEMCEITNGAPKGDSPTRGLETPRLV
jgi:hypothetical protein